MEPPKVPSPRGARKLRSVSATATVKSILYEVRRWQVLWGKKKIEQDRRIESLERGERPAAVLNFVIRASLMRK